MRILFVVAALFSLSVEAQEPLSTTYTISPWVDAYLGYWKGERHGCPVFLHVDYDADTRRIVQTYVDASGEPLLDKPTDFVKIDALP